MLMQVAMVLAIAFSVLLLNGSRFWRSVRRWRRRILLWHFCHGIIGGGRLFGLHEIAERRGCGGVGA